MNNNPKVSVIIPTYNRVLLLGRAIESVLNQTYQEFELIIIDDGSTDGTYEVIKEFQKKDNRIIYLKHDKNKGGSAARNTGIKASRGEYIAFLDSDDEWLPEKLEKQIQLFMKSSDSDLGLVGSGAIFVFSNLSQNKYSYVKPTQKGDIFFILFEGKYVPAGGSIFLIYKKVFKKCGLFDESLILKEGGQQDYEMWLRIAKEYRIDNIDDYLVKYHFHSGERISSSKITKRVQSIEYVIKKYESDFKNYPKFYSKKLCYLGSQFCQSGNIRVGRKYFNDSLKYNRFNLKTYLYWFVSFFGPNIYKKLYKYVINFNNSGIMKIS